MAEISEAWRRPAPALPRAIRAGAASWIETLLTLAVIAALLPAFLALRPLEAGRDQRFAAEPLRVSGLPEPVLPRLCASFGSLAEPALRERLCRDQDPGPSQSVQSLPAVLTDAAGRARQAFLAPLAQAQARLRELQVQQREGVGDLLALSNSIEALSADIAPYSQRYRLDATGELGPLPLHCAVRRVEAALASGAAGAPRGNAVLLLAAALDGNAATSALAGSAVLPGGSARALPPCEGLPLAGALGEAALLMAQARQDPANADKNRAMRALLRTAGWQWAGWMLLGLALLKLSRRIASPWAGASLAIALWAGAAWLSRTPWPFAPPRAFEPARVEAALASMPAGFVWWMLAAAAVLWLLPGRRPVPRRAQTLASRLGYPGLALFTGVGWVLLLDLSANAHLSNRYLALYHQGHLWLGMCLLGTLLFLRQPLARAAAWSLAVIDELASRLRARLGVVGGRLLAGLLALLLIAIGGWLIADLRQLTSEIGRVWLIVGAAWFFFLRGGPLAERLARSAGTAGSLLRYVSPLLFVGLVLIGWMLVTRDMGPLLIAVYGAGAFLAAAVAMWRQQRRGPGRAGAALAVALFALWIAAVTAAVLRFGALDEVTAVRLESRAAPLASANDQLAVVRWFQQAAPPGGFGIGAAPWCGHAPDGGCAGVPAQIHSDYSFTAMVGVFGAGAAWVLTLACAGWLHRLVRRHGRVTQGEPRLLRAAGRVGNDDQAFLSWVCVAWVVLSLCQLAVTVAGNLAVLPLTGVTYPFVSFGMTSLLVNMGFLALSLNLSLPDGDRGG